MPKTSSDDKKPAPRRKKRPRISGFRWFSLLLTMLVFGAIGGLVWAFLPASPSTETGETVKVEIPNQSSAREIAARLRAKGVIRSETAFLVMAKILDETSNMQAGDYRVSPHMTLVQIINLMSRGEGLAKWVTLPEGYTLKQIAETLDENKLGDARRIERIARAGGKSFRGEVSFDPPQNLEGFLFPDTYKVPLKTTERQLVEKMLKTFDQKVAVPLKSQIKQAQSQGRSIRDVVILASLVEREARKKEEQPVIAGVLLNRLKQGMRLQVDATVQYALAAPKRRLYFKDLEIASPYNTYKIEGLPPGPICSPGVSAIKAALNPTDTKALYYVAKPDGGHIFTRTFEEHKAARKKAQRLSSQSS